MKRLCSITKGFKQIKVRESISSTRCCSESGQGLVELAIIILFLMLLVVGTIEVGNLLNTQNKVSTASRSATVYGAARFSGDDFTVNNDWAMEMANVAVQNVANTLVADPSTWDVWSIKLTTNDDGTGFSQWIAVHSYGNHNVVDVTEWSALEQQIQLDILEKLKEDGADASNLEAVSVVDFHERERILGISFIFPDNTVRLRGLTVARVDRPPIVTTCLIMPIAIRVDQYSYYPSNYVGPSISGYRGDPIDQPDARKRNIWSPNEFAFPQSSDDWDYILPGDEIYTVPNPTVFEQPNNFFDNVPGVPLLYAQKGYIYEARTHVEDGDSSAFGWLDWNSPPDSASNLADGLSYPNGNYLDPDDGYVGSPMDMDIANGRGDGDGTLEVGEWVQVSTGNISSGEGQIRDLIDNGRPVRIIVYDLEEGGGSNRIFRVAGFVLVRMVGYKFGGQQETRKVGVEFIRWEDSCSGQLEE
jgi:hypothetical protein